METTKALRKEILARTAGKDQYGGGCNVRDAQALCRDVEVLVDGQKDPDGRLVFRVAVLDLPAMDKSPEQVARELVAIWQQATRDAEYAVTKMIGQGPRTEAELLVGHNLEFNVRVELERDQASAVLDSAQEGE